MAESGLRGPEVAEWLERLDADHANLRAAIAFALADEDAETALLLCGGLWHYWMLRGNLAEGRAFTDSALALAGGPPGLRQRALTAAAVLAAEQGEFAQARRLFEDSLELACEVGDRHREARARGNLGIIALYAGDHREAIRRYEQATEIMRELDDERDVALMTQNLGIAYNLAGDRERAITLLTESIERARKVGDPGHLASTLRSLGRVLAVDDPGTAITVLRENLELARDLNDSPALVETFETLAAVADPESGAVLVGAAAALRAAAGAIASPDEAAWLARTEADLRSALGDAAFAAGVDVGRRLAVDDAVARALAVTA
jgi:tetratricopeptide (TPR) repeat protein